MIFTLDSGMALQFDKNSHSRGAEYQSEGRINLAEHGYKLTLQKNLNLAEAHMDLGVI